MDEESGFTRLLSNAVCSLARSALSCFTAAAWLELSPEAADFAIALRWTVTASPAEAEEVAELPPALEPLFPSSAATTGLLKVEPTDVTLMKQLIDMQRPFVQRHAYVLASTSEYRVSRTMHRKANNILTQSNG